MGGKENIVARRRRVDRQTMRAISPLPPPEEVFADWLVSVSGERNIQAAARREIDRIDSHAPLHPDMQVLRVLLAGLAGSGDWHKHVSNL